MAFTTEQPIRNLVNVEIDATLEALGYHPDMYTALSSNTRAYLVRTTVVGLKTEIKRLEFLLSVAV